MPHPPHVSTPGALETGEFTRADDAARIAAKYLGATGRCYGSMTAYCRLKSAHLTVKDANVCSVQHGKLWWGDLDVTENATELRALSQELGVTIFVLFELDARFENAECPRFSNAIYATDWHDPGFVPTRLWASDEWLRRHR